MLLSKTEIVMKAEKILATSNETLINDLNKASFAIVADWSKENGIITPHIISAFTQQFDGDFRKFLRAKNTFGRANNVKVGRPVRAAIFAILAIEESRKNIRRPVLAGNILERFSK